MHESAIAKSILEIVQTRLQSLRSNAVALKVSVILGEFRNVEAESVQFAFDNMKVFYSGVENCQLEASTIVSLAKCKDSDHKYHPEPQLAYRCPLCGAGIGRLLQGEELDVVNVVVELDSVGKEKEHARLNR